MIYECVTIAGAERYTIDTKGRVFDKKLGRHLKPGTIRGYKSVCLETENGRKGFRIHRLVASAFIPNPNGYPIINHKDENPSNNNVENLEWCTYKYNANYGTAQQRRVANTDYTTENRKVAARRNGKLASRPVVQYDSNGIVIGTFPSINDATRMTGIRHIQECCNRSSKYSRVGGCVWRYSEDSYE